MINYGNYTKIAENAYKCGHQFWIQLSIIQQQQQQQQQRQGRRIGLVAVQCRGNVIADER